MVLKPEVKMLFGLLVLLGFALTLGAILTDVELIKHTVKVPVITERTVKVVTPTASPSAALSPTPTPLLFAPKRAIK